ncbi:unnamed protein product [Anisakis simplex]|uniref:Uncharacterized protein n=1 Tax=Anisakis simplex TaxID=6269 RepID=A0A0M3K466_ANISI|nr:unnamed protein product [Anisakis simplex]
MEYIYQGNNEPMKLIMNTYEDDKYCRRDAFAQMDGWMDGRTQQGGTNCVPREAVKSSILYEPPQTSSSTACSIPLDDGTRPSTRFIGHPS